jgi:transposase
MNDTEQKYSSETISAEQYYLLQKQNEELLLQTKQLQADNAFLKHELDNLKRMIFGSKSERFIPADSSQLPLFGMPASEVPEPGKETITYERQKPVEPKNVPVRLALPAHLPRVEEVIEPTDDISGAKKIGETVTEILEYTPGKLFVKKYIRPKYVLSNPESIVIGQLPSLPIPRGNAGPGLLAHLLISKFVDHLPFYRQVQMFKRQDISIAESTINDWFTQACRLLEPLYDRLKEKVQHTDYLMADETPIAVLTHDKPNATHKGYHWVYFSPIEKLVCFDYRQGRGREGPEEFLQDFHGAIQTDGYSAYTVFEIPGKSILLSCMAHARRKFDQAQDNDKERAQTVLKMMQPLYELEQLAREYQLSFEERKILRQKMAVDKLMAIEKWLKENLIQVLPRSAIGQAIAYTLNLWPRLIRYIEDGRFEIDNNLVENSIRPVALGRKNYLFAGSHEGAKRAAMIYSFLGTCKKNYVEPFTWLRDVLTRIPDWSIQRLDELLPVKPLSEETITPL